jgi:hypothetical protein
MPLPFVVLRFSALAFDRGALGAEYIVSARVSASFAALGCRARFLRFDRDPGLRRDDDFPGGKRPKGKVRALPFAKRAD